MLCRNATRWSVLTRIALVALLLALTSTHALAAEFTVNSTADSTSGECASTCTLRGAIAAAHLSSDASNTINVPAGTYEFGPAEAGHPTTTGELRLTNTTGTTLTIKGAGVGATIIDAAGHDRAISVTGGGSDVLEGLTVEKGFQHEDEAFTQLDDRGAGILQSGGELTIDRARFTEDINNGYGGGIDVEGNGTLKILDSEFDHDVGNNGGGGAVSMQAGTTLDVSDTTFYGDTSGTGSGGAVLAVNAHSTFSNVTFADDGWVSPGLTYEGGAVYLEEGTASFLNVTFSGDIAGGSKGGGSDINASEGARVSLTNILLGPTGEGGLDQACAGSSVGVALTWQNLGGNLSTDETCALAGGQMGVALGVGEIGSNGGPTKTVPLLAGSPATDIGVSGCPATDQRGYGRLGQCDSGAFEFGGVAPAAGGGPPPAVSVTPTTPPAAGPSVASTPKAIEALRLGCVPAELTLNDAYIRGSRVLLSGAAAKRFVGKKVTILFNKSKPVATATVKANGQFVATAPLPPAKIRKALTTRYSAAIGRLRSLHLKLTRRLQLEPPTASGTTVTLAGHVELPLTKPIAPIAVEEQLECGKVTIAKTFTPTANGRFRIQVSVPANARAAIFQLKSTVAANRHATKHGFTTYSLPLPVALG